SIGARGPGKRQIKPTAAVLDLVLPNAEDEEDDEDFVADNENGSNEGSDSDGSDSDGSEDSSDSSSSTDVDDEENDDVEKDGRNAVSVEGLAGDGKEVSAL
ncbi:hypothetical protein Y032_1711g3945, partial [Ancylostoma ceylanicum]